MDIRHLQYFLEVAQQQSFTKAAQQLNVSQPALSKMIRNLEEDLEVTLLDRSNKQIQLTDAGQAVLEQAQRVLGMMEDLTTSLYDTIHLQKGAISFGLPPLIGTLFFPGIIANFRKTYPGISIQITEYGAKKMEQSLIEGQVELAIAVAPVDQSIFESIPFTEEKMKVVMPNHHTLANLGQIELKELSKEKFILFQEDFAMHDLIRNHCLEQGFIPHIELESSQWDFIVEMVRANMGIAILPESICAKIHTNDVKAIPLSNPSIPWKLELIIKKDRYLSFATREFIQFVKDFRL
ncbi:LysR family transcriptional regulator [Pontibacillus yanchengensis]|uniref:LysR family transcriptional regulator n=1 Tax=Pontibacillus yanchengensis Y32 TaxID=1385514 RepID=A0A0A2TPA5_9BACI|nr:LysR family transcriptional regulator [Pontibacillus yanchengensis]KGP71175.1 LysR family transcriptional regulator [Pontibacillus yanchengensis Y32]